MTEKNYKRRISYDDFDILRQIAYDELYSISEETKINNYADNRIKGIIGGHRI